jgi:hypothetical protein
MRRRGAVDLPGRAGGFRAWSARTVPGFRNVRANPHVRIYTGGRRPATATARLLASDETAAALAADAAGHPRAWAALKPVLEATLGARISDQETSLPMIAFEVPGGCG